MNFTNFSLRYTDFRLLMSTLVYIKLPKYRQSFAYIVQHVLYLGFCNIVDDSATQTPSPMVERL